MIFICFISRTNSMPEKTLSLDNVGNILLFLPENVELESQINKKYLKNLKFHRKNPLNLIIMIVVNQE